MAAAGLAGSRYWNRATASGSRVGQVPPDPGEPPAAPERPRSASPIRFVEVSRETGIDFQHTDGSSGRHYIVEAMSAGLPALTTDVGGIGTCLADGVHAEVVQKVPDDEGDLTPATLADASIGTHLADLLAVLDRLGIALKGKLKRPAAEGRAVARLTDLGHGQALRDLFRDLWLRTNIDANLHYAIAEYDQMIEAWDETVQRNTKQHFEI